MKRKNFLNVELTCRPQNAINTSKQHVRQRMVIAIGRFSVKAKQQRGNISGLAASIAGFATLTFGLMMWFFSQQKDQDIVIIALLLGACNFTLKRF